MKIELDDDTDLNRELVSPPHLSGGKLLRIRNEFAFSRFSLSIQAQRILFTAMSYFDIYSFLEHSENYDSLNNQGNRDFSRLTDQHCRDFYFCKEYRAIILTIKILLNSTNSNSRNYSAFNNAIEELKNLHIILDVPNELGKRTRQKIKVVDFCVKTEKSEVVIVFNQDFMPYVLSLRGYTKLELSVVNSFKNKLTHRYFHWFSLRLGEKNSASFEMRKSELRARFELDVKVNNRHFWQRIVMTSIDEINEKTDLLIDAKPIYNQYLKGKPLEKIEFVIQRKMSTYFNGSAQDDKTELYRF
ncbi:replication initiation protein [Vibrio parahaemolyticus]|uniref:replication initiation protein n=1 Tax=Vibrio parahaemolyticus TaxID=670 RepID=UPI001120A60B|nr:replication initiation protein [Vibrio parahaemolyticus]TNZ95748.1 hypothetical protein CGK38_03265 [Vibrio parahaemolyticus]